MRSNDALGDLARLASTARGSSGFEDARKRAVSGFNSSFDVKPLNRRAIDLLGAVLALSARTRRVVQPRVEIDLDVYTPRGKRAVSLALGDLN